VSLASASRERSPYRSLKACMGGIIHSVWGPLRAVGVRASNARGTCLYLYLLALATDELGPIPAPVRDCLLFGGGLFFMGGWMFARQMGPAGAVEAAVRSGICLLVALGSVNFQHLFGGVSGPCLLLVATDVYLRRRRGIPGEWSTLYLTTWLYALMDTYLRYAPSTWGWLDEMSRLCSAAVGALTQHPVWMGPSVVGFPLMALVACYSAASFRQGLRPIWKQWPALFGVFITLGAYVLLAEWLSGWTPVRQRGVHLGLENLQPLLLGFLCLVCSPFWCSREETPPPRWGNGVDGAVLILLTVLAAFVLTWPRLQERGAGVITFWDTAQDNILVDWKKPVAGRYGIDSGGMNGLCRDYLEAMGFKTELKGGEITGAKLAKTRVLVFINPTMQFKREEQASIEAFVREGGALLVVGEHTDVAGVRSSANTLVSPFGIALNFDSAWPYRSRWRGCAEILPHSATALVPHEAAGFLSVGCSLKLRAPATPLILGRFGFADQGDPLDRGRGGQLGDGLRSGEEKLGDLVLVAQSQVGKGKVVVFGDASPFQNAALPESYPLLDGLFRWLTCLEHRSLWRSNPALSLVFLGLGVWWFRARNVGLLPVAGATWLWCFIASLAVPMRVLAPARPSANVPLAYIDTGHLNRVSHFPESRYALWSLYYNCVRNGLLPLTGHRLPARCRVAVVIAPARPYNPSEASRMHTFVAQGGLLVVCVGYPQHAGVQSLLSPFKVAIGPNPLGSLQVRVPGQKEAIQFRDAWPLLCPPQAEVLASHEGTVVAARLRMGRGHLVVVGDPYFLLTERLESRAGYYPGNVRFLATLLSSTAVTRGAER